jgi:hypothetical protein
MNLTDKANQLKKRIAPGIWEDKKGQVHFSIPELLALHDLEDTPENHVEVKKMLVELMKKNNPNTPVLFRKSPTDDGEDLR